MQQMREYKRRAFSLGLDLMGYSTHQDLLRPTLPSARRTWKRPSVYRGGVCHGHPDGAREHRPLDTSADFDVLMKNRGSEPALPGHTDEEAFGWEKEASSRSSRMPRSARHRPWDGEPLGAGDDACRNPARAERRQLALAQSDAGHGQFPGGSYDRIAQLAPHAVLVQAKTYYGGGRWYTLDLDYGRIAAIIRKPGIRATFLWSLKETRRWFQASARVWRCSENIFDTHVFAL